MGRKEIYKEMDQPDAHVNVLFPIPCIIRKIFQPKLHYPMAEPHPASGMRGASVAVFIFLIQGKFTVSVRYQWAGLLCRRQVPIPSCSPSRKLIQNNAPVTRESVPTVATSGQ